MIFIIYNYSIYCYTNILGSYTHTIADSHTIISGSDFCRTQLGCAQQVALDAPPTRCVAVVHFLALVTRDKLTILDAEDVAGPRSYRSKRRKFERMSQIGIKLIDNRFRSWTCKV